MSLDGRKRPRSNELSGDSDDELSNDAIEEMNLEDYEMAMKRSRQGGESSDEDSTNAETDQGGDGQNVLFMYANSPPKQYPSVPKSPVTSNICDKTLETIVEESESLLEKTVLSQDLETPTTPCLLEMLESLENSNLTVLELPVLEVTCEMAEVKVSEPIEVEASELIQVQVLESPEIPARESPEIPAPARESPEIETSGSIEVPVSMPIEVQVDEMMRVPSTEVEAGEKTEDEASELPEFEVSGSIEVEASKSPEVQIGEMMRVRATEVGTGEKTEDEESELTSKKISFCVDMSSIDPCDYVEDPNERKLPDLRSNRADPIGYVAAYPRKGEKITPEIKKGYSDRMQQEFDDIQQAIFDEQRKSLTYIKWAPPIPIPMATDDHGDTEPSPNRRSLRISSYQAETIVRESESLKSTAAAGKSESEKISKSSHTLQVDDDDDSDDIQPSQSKRTWSYKKKPSGKPKHYFDHEFFRDEKPSSRKRKNSGEEKVVDEDAESGSRSFNKKSVKGRKVDYMNYPDDDEVEGDSRKRKSSGEASTSRVTTRSAAQGAGEPVPSVDCPMCGVSFSATLVNEHAFRCQGKDGDDQW